MIRLCKKLGLDVEGEHQMLPDERENDDSIPEPDLPQRSFSIQVSFSPVPVPDDLSNVFWQSRQNLRN